MNKITSLYRPNIGIMVINNKGKVLICNRSDVEGDAWQMPQGGIDSDEAPIAAGLRELEEETGITANKLEIIDLWDEFQYYEYPLDQITACNEVIGQKQKWLVVKYLDSDTSINLKNAKDSEFTDYKWETMANLVNIIWKPKKAIYRRLAKKYEEILA